jgi:hypothetical protein
LDRWLTEATDAHLPVSNRAARVYLDLAFLHPFADGNARAARLAADAVLWRDGLMLRTVRPLFTVWRSPEDVWGAGSLAWMMGRWACPRHR